MVVTEHVLVSGIMIPKLPISDMLALQNTPTTPVDEPLPLPPEPPKTTSSVIIKPQSTTASTTQLPRARPKSSVITTITKTAINPIQIPAKEPKPLVLKRYSSAIGFRTRSVPTPSGDRVNVSAILEKSNRNFMRSTIDFANKKVESTQDKPKLPKRPASATATRPKPQLRSTSPNFMNVTKSYSLKKDLTAQIGTISEEDLFCPGRKSSTGMRMRISGIEPSKRVVPPPVVIKKRSSTPQKDKMDIVVPKKSIADSALALGMGTVALPSHRITSLQGIGIQDELKVLYIHNNYLTSFQFLGSQPNLEVLYAANNCIATFYKLETQPKLQVVNLEGNPITKHARYRIMLLIAAGTQIKKIDNETVGYKEREFAKLQIATNPLIVDAIRAGWLMDLESKTTNDFKKIIDDLEMINWDDREAVRNSQAFVHLKGTPTVVPVAESLAKFDPKNVAKKTETNIAVQNQYSQELRALKSELARKNAELRTAKETMRTIQETHLSADDLNICTTIDIDGFSIQIEQEITLIRIRITSGMLLLLRDDIKHQQVSFNKITKTSLISDEQRFFKIYVHLLDHGTVELLHPDKKNALALYKLLHLFIARSSRIRKEQNLAKLSVLATSKKRVSFEKEEPAQVSSTETPVDLEYTRSPQEAVDTSIVLFDEEQPEATVQEEETVVEEAVVEEEESHETIEEEQHEPEEEQHHEEQEELPEEEEHLHEESHDHLHQTLLDDDGEHILDYEQEELLQDYDISELL